VGIFFLGGVDPLLENELEERLEAVAAGLGLRRPEPPERPRRVSRLRFLSLSSLAFGICSPGSCIQLYMVLVFFCFIGVQEGGRKILAWACHIPYRQGVHMEYQSYNCSTFRGTDPVVVVFPLASNVVVVGPLPNGAKKGGWR
jgi:hypothetical protein